MINFLKKLILLIGWFSYSMFFMYFFYNNGFIRRIYNFFEASFKNQDIAVVVFVSIFLLIPMAIIEMIWQKIFHR